MGGGRTLPSMLGNNYLLLLWTLLSECEARRSFWNWRTLVEEEFWSSPSWIHGQDRGWTKKVYWLFYSKVGRNLAIPFVVQQISHICSSILSHELHSETGCWLITKTPWDERVCHLCDTKKVEDEKNFLLDCPAYTQIRYYFQNICHTTNLPNLLTQQNYGDLGNLLLMLFDHRNKILENWK